MNAKSKLCFSAAILAIGIVVGVFQTRGPAQDKSPRVIPSVASVTTTGNGGVSSCAKALNDGLRAFRDEQYDAALEFALNGLQACPDSPDLNELRALVMFAQGNYHQASASLHAALAARPGWKWEVVGRLYGDVAVYTAQLRALEGHIRKHPDDGGARFLLAYHYIVDGYPDAAIRELEMVIRFEYDDRVASALLKSLPRPAASTSTTLPRRY